MTTNFSSARLWTTDQLVQDDVQEVAELAVAAERERLACGVQNQLDYLTFWMLSILFDSLSQPTFLCINDPRPGYTKAAGPRTQTAS